MMTLSCRIVNVKPKVKMKNEDVDVLWVCVCVANFLIFSYLCARVLQEKILSPLCPKKEFIKLLKLFFNFFSIRSGLLYEMKINIISISFLLRL